MAKPLTKRVDLLRQVHGFVVSVPTNPIHNANPLHQTHRDFRAKLDGRPGFAAHNRPDMWLAETHQPVSDAMTAMRVYPELLPIQFLNHEHLEVPLGS